MSENKPVFEELMAELERLVALLENGGAGGLEASLAAYEKAVKVSDELNAILDESEKRVMVLSQTGESPFSAEDLQ